MLKIALVVGPTNKNLEQDDQRIQVENQEEKEPAPKSHISQQMAKSKKWIRAKKAEAFKTENLG